MAKATRAITSTIPFIRAYIESPCAVEHIAENLDTAQPHQEQTGDSDAIGRDGNNLCIGYENAHNWPAEQPKHYQNYDGDHGTDFHGGRHAQQDPLVLAGTDILPGIGHDGGTQYGKDLLHQKLDLRCRGESTDNGLAKVIDDALQNDAGHINQGVL